MSSSRFFSLLWGAVRRSRGTQTARRGPSPIQVIALSFVLLIAVGSVLLLLPVSQRPGQRVPLLDCVFTATSATCVTGLVTVSTADAWTRFGQVVIMALIQIGGLGYMTVATIVAVGLGLRVGLRARLQLMEAHGAPSLHDAMRIGRYAVLGTLAIESVGALVLALDFRVHHGAPWGEAAFSGVFHSVSAFCNAGFDLFPGFQGLGFPGVRFDAVLLVMVSLLVILGGVGFSVLAELVSFSQTRRFTLHAKLVMTTTGVLLLIGAALFYALEFRNPATLAAMDSHLQRGVTAWFMSVTPRTAGFSPVDLSRLAPPTLLLIALLMMIGASPGSTGGGIKTTTIAIIFLAVLALVRRQPDVEAYRRRIGGEMVRLAVSLASAYVLAVMLAMIILGLIDVTLPGLPLAPQTTTYYAHLMFEVVSAFGTVGLSAGITPGLGSGSRMVIIAAMYLGRLGPLAFVFAFAQPKRTLLRRLPEEPVIAG